MRHSLFAAMLLVSVLAHAAPKTEAQVHEFRQIMQSANQDLKQGKLTAAFNKIKAMAEKGFVDAQYILATLYHDGEGTKQDLNQARLWYQKAAVQQENAAVASLAKEALEELEQVKP